MDVGEGVLTELCLRQEFCVCPHIHRCLSIPTFLPHTDLGTQEVLPADWLSHRAKSKERTEGTGSV